MALTGILQWIWVDRWWWSGEIKYSSWLPSIFGISLHGLKVKRSKISLDHKQTVSCHDLAKKYLIVCISMTVPLG